MKKLLGIVVLGLLRCNASLADINLNCVMLNWNERDLSTNEFKYTSLKPSHFTAIIEIIGPSEVIGRLTGSAEVGYNIHSPYAGTISDSRIEMNHKKNKLDERGTDFNLNLISGMFEMNHHIGKKDEIWFLQKTGRCEVAN